MFELSRKLNLKISRPAVVVLIALNFVSYEIEYLFEGPILSDFDQSREGSISNSLHHQ